MALAEHAHPLRGYFYIAIAAFCWGMAGVAARAIFAGKLLASAHAAAIDPLVLSQTRTTISFLLLAPSLWVARRLQIAPRSRITRGQLLRVLLIGSLGIAASNFLYYVSIQQTSVAVAIMLQYLAPVWALAYLLGRGLQRPTAGGIAGVALAVGGCALAVGIAPGHTSFGLLGIVAGLGASFAFAFYNVLGRSLLEQLDRWSVFLFSMLGATLFWTIVNPPWRLVSAHYSALQWEFLVGFAIFSILVPYAFYFSGLRHLDATRAIVTSCLEPAFAIALAWMILGDAVSPLQIVGITAVLAGTIVVQRP